MKFTLFFLKMKHHKLLILASLLMAIRVFFPSLVSAAGCVIWYQQQEKDVISGNYSTKILTPPACTENIPGKELSSATCRAYVEQISSQLSSSEGLRYNSGMYVPDLSCAQIATKSKDEIMSKYNWEETINLPTLPGEDGKTAGCYCTIPGSGLGSRYFAQFSQSKEACLLKNNTVIDLGTVPQPDPQNTAKIQCEWLEAKPNEDQGGYSLPSADVLNQFSGLSIQNVIGNGIATAMKIMGSIAFAIMVFAGFMWMTAGGNSDRSKKSMDMMVWAALGVVVILSSYTIVKFVFDSFTN